MKNLLSLLLVVASSTASAVTLRDPSALSTNGNDATTYYSVRHLSQSIGNVFLIVGTLDVIGGKSINTNGALSCVTYRYVGIQGESAVVEKTEFVSAENYYDGSKDMDVDTAIAASCVVPVFNWTIVGKKVTTLYMPTGKAMTLDYPLKGNTLRLNIGADTKLTPVLK